MEWMRYEAQHMKNSTYGGTWTQDNKQQQKRTIKVSEMTESLHRHYKSTSHGKDCLKR